MAAMEVDYKYKPDKHKCHTGICTIDELHNAHMTKFKKNLETIPQKKNELRKIEEELQRINEYAKENPLNMNGGMLKRKMFLEDEASKKKDEISDIEKHRGEMAYFGKITDIIYDYYDLTNGNFYNNKFEKTDNTFNNDQPDTKSDKIDISDELLKLTMANKLNKIKRPVKKRNKKIEDTNRKTIMSYLINADEKLEDKSLRSRATLEKEYMAIINKNVFNNKKLPMSKKCEKCGTQMIIIYTESLLCCPNPKCGEAETIFIEYEVPSQKDTFNEKPKYPYRRIGHCIEKLNQFQSKGSTNVPASVFRMLEEELKKHNMCRKDISINFIEKMLKKHKMSNHYENVMYLYSQLTDTPPMTLTRKEIDIIISMFLKAEELYYTKYKPPDRDNFLKYSFTLHKIFLTIEKPDYAKCFKLLKSHSKMKQQESIWKNICDDAGWPYHSS